MFAIISRKRLAIAGAVVAITAGGAGGTILAGRVTAAPVAATSSGQSQAQAAATPSPSQNTKAPHQGKGLPRKLLGDLHLVKVVKLDGQQLTVVDASGTQTTDTVASGARVVGPKQAPETLSSLKPGELVIIATGHRQRAAPNASPGAQPSTGADSTVMLIRDTGFVAA